ncbi:hypothetical protein B0A53_05425 [Rhodotorula sp. CCFEE 5036]|nr:hypothetical protein B0A53_05425 [Rhodotorula sp. CCFEE 5036]
MTTGTGRIKTSLLSLPDELLSAIFSEVVRTHGSRTATLVSTCRRLAPIVRQEVYWELRVGNDEAQSDVLSELCANRPDLRRLVRVLHVERPIQEVHERKMIVYDYIDVHPCIKLLHSDFPALHTLSVYQATPIDIFTILSRVAATTRPDIRKLTLQCAPGSVDSVYKRHKTICPDEILFEHHLRISVNATFTDEIMLDLVDGPMHMKYLKVLQLDYTYGIDPWANCDLVLAHVRQTQFNLARVKAELSPKWPPGCSPEGLRTMLDAARQMGIKVYGTALDCLDWSDRFDELSERLLVDDALASNNYTIIERHLGKEGAEKAIVRVSGRDLRS